MNMPAPNIESTTPISAGDAWISARCNGTARNAMPIPKAEANCIPTMPIGPPFHMPTNFDKDIGITTVMSPFPGGPARGDTCERQHVWRLLASRGEGLPSARWIQWYPGSVDSVLNLVTLLALTPN